jgi:hypothetical protein
MAVDLPKLLPPSLSAILSSKKSLMGQSFEIPLKIFPANVIKC